MKNKYFLITVQHPEGWTNTFVGTGASAYAAFLNQVKERENKHGFIYHKSLSIIFSQEATKEDYEAYRVNVASIE